MMQEPNAARGGRNFGQVELVTGPLRTLPQEAWTLVSGPLNPLRLRKSWPPKGKAGHWLQRNTNSHWKAAAIVA